MYQSSQQSDINRLNKYISMSSPKFKSYSNHIIASLQKFNNFQQKRFQQIQKGCTFLQTYITNLQEMFDKLEQKISLIQQQRSTQTISNLKNKQNEFIIMELKQKNKKYQKNQQNLQIQLKHIKKQLQNMKRSQKQKDKFIGQVSKYKQQILTLTKQINEKDNKIQQLTIKLQKMTIKQKQDKKNNNGQKNKKQKQQEFKLLQSKLLQLERDFDNKITSLQQQIKNKNNQIKELKFQLERKDKQMEYKDKQFQLKLKSIEINMKQSDKLPSFNYGEQVPSTMTMTFNPALKNIKKTNSQTESNHSNQQNTSASSTYQLQLKLNHQQILYKQLQQQYTSHLTQSNNLQIQLHQQIHTLKIQIQQDKKKYKTQKKKVIQLLQSLCSFINKRTFNYFDNNLQIQNIVEEIKKVYQKQKEKWQKEVNEVKKQEQELNQKINQSEKQNRKYKNQNSLFKQQTQNIKQQLNRVIAQRQKEKQKERERDKEREKERQKQRQKQRKAKKQSASIISNSNQGQKKSIYNKSQYDRKSQLNGSIGQISNSNTKSQTPSILEQKYKSMIQTLKSQISQKQSQISELQRLQSIDFQKSKQKILMLEQQLADNKNQYKRLQRQRKQDKQRISELNKQIQQLKSNIQQNKQKYQKDKQQIQINHDIKIKGLEEKITKLKQQNQIIQNKSQQKVMKYNKLKSKVEKLQMYNSQTQKRKDNQIQDLIKKNQQFKMEIKLLQEKIHIANALSLTSNGNTNNGNEQQSNDTKTVGYNKDLIEQIQMERDRILQQYETKRRQNIKLRQNIQKLQQQVSNKQSQKNKIQTQKTKLQLQKTRLLSQNNKNFTKFSQQKIILSNQLTQIKKQLSQSKKQFNQLNKLLKLQKLNNQQVTKQLNKLKQEISNKSKQQYQHLKKQLENQLQNKKKLQSQLSKAQTQASKLQKQEAALVQRIKQLKQQNQKLKKDITQKAKSLQIRWQQKYKQKTNHHHEQLHKLKQQTSMKIKDLQQKLSQAQIRQQNLVNIINYKNMTTSGTLVRQSMRGEEHQVGQQEVKQYNFQDLPQIKELQIPQVKQLVINENKIDEQTNTQAKQLKLFLQSSIVSEIIEPKLSINKLSIEKLSNISIKPIHKQLIDQQSQVNIFENNQSLYQYLKQNYQHIIEYIINLNIPKIQDRTNKNQQQIRLIKQTAQIGINTQTQARPSYKKSDRSSIHNRQSINNRQSNRQSINNRQQQENRQSIKSYGIKQSSFILQKDWFGSQDPSHSSVQQTPIPDSNDLITHLPITRQTKQKFNPHQVKVEINLFQNLIKPSNLNLQLQQQNIDDNFQICQQGQSINVGRTALNLQIKQIFNKLRQQLQKVFNGEEISLSMIKILPRQLEDDYNQFIAYVREKITQIKSENQLSFIMAQVGDSPQLDQELDQQLKNFIDKKTIQDLFTYKKLVQQKQALITSLMNERTMQQNTINQMTMEKQQVQEQHENRFMNQCNIYKKEIKELKNKVDNLQMAFQSLKNIFKNTMEIWVDQIQNQDDLRDNFTIYKNIGKLNEIQSTRLNYYIYRYREIKGIADD